MTQECSLPLFLFSIVLRILVSAMITWNKKYKEGRKQSLFAKRHEISKIYENKLLELVSNFSKILAFLYTRRNQLGNKIKG